MFRDKLGPGYYAGIWQGDLIPGLLWHSAGGSAGYADTDSSAPSWSWASLPGLEFNPPSNLGTLSKSEALVRVLETKTATSTTNPFGPVHSGFVKFWGHVWRAEVIASELFKSKSGIWPRRLKVAGYLENSFTLEFDMSLTMVDVCLPDGARERSMRRIRRDEFHGKFYIGNLREGESIHLIMIPLLKDEFPERNDHKRDLTYGLILGRSCKDPTKYERLGRFRVFNLTTVDSQAYHENPADDFSEQEIEII
jgi:hypothetical protein